VFSVFKKKIVPKFLDQVVQGSKSIRRGPPSAFLGIFTVINIIDKGGPLLIDLEPG